MSAEDIRRGAETLGGFVLGSLMGLLGPRQNVQQVTTRVNNALTSIFENSVSTEIESRQALKNFNSNNISISSEGGCIINVQNFTQNINSMSGINVVLNQEQYTQFVNQTMARFTNDLQSQITRNGTGLEQIFAAVAGLLGKPVEQVKSEATNQFTSVVRNLYSADLRTDTRITVDNQNRTVIACTGPGRITLTGTLQNIVQNSIVALRVRQVQQGIATSQLVIDVSTKLRSGITENSWFWWIVAAIAILIIIFLIGLAVWFFSKSGSSQVATEAMNAVVTAGPSLWPWFLFGFIFLIIIFFFIYWFFFRQ